MKRDEEEDDDDVEDIIALFAMLSCKDPLQAYNPKAYAHKAKLHDVTLTLKSFEANGGPGETGVEVLLVTLTVVSANVVGDVEFGASSLNICMKQGLSYCYW